MAEGFERTKFFILDVLQTIVIAAAIFLIVWQLLLQPHKVEGKSMEPTFCNREMILTDKVSYRFRTPERFEVVVFQSPTQRGRDLIKRVIALPNETVGLTNGRLTINGQELPEPYIPPSVRTDEKEWLREGEQKVVPQNQYIMVGDNRNHSEDSRLFGPVKESLVRGRVWIRYWPPTAVSIIPKGNEQVRPRSASCS